MINERIINYFKFNNKIIYDLNTIKLHITNKNFNVKLNIDFHYLQTFNRKYFEIKKYNFEHKFLTNDIDLLSVDNKEIRIIYLFKMLTYSLFTYD